MCCHPFFLQFGRNLRNLFESSLHRQVRPTSSRVLLGPCQTHSKMAHDSADIQGFNHAETFETDGDTQAYKTYHGDIWIYMEVRSSSKFGYRVSLEIYDVGGRSAGQMSLSIRPGNGLPGKRLEWWRPTASPHRQRYPQFAGWLTSVGKSHGN